MSKKKYIFFAGQLQPMGGAQNYLKNKSEYLKNKNYCVYIVSAGFSKSPCGYSTLDQYLDGVNHYLYINPKEIFGTLKFYNAVYKIIQYIEYDKSDDCEYYIESNHDLDSVWAEIISRIIGGKHICLLTMEYFDSPDSWYFEYVDYFKYKYDQNALFGIHPNSISNLLSWKYRLCEKEKRVFKVGISNNVENIFDERLNFHIDSDFIIGYFGRTEKRYVPRVFAEVDKFAKEQKKFNIDFWIIGEESQQLKNLLKSEHSNNLKIRFLGTFNPLPHFLFEKVDCMIAGAGCACISANQRTFTLVPNAITGNCSGILGISVHDSMYGNEVYSYNQLLNEIIIEKKYNKNSINMELLDIYFNNDFDDKIENMDHLNEKISYDFNWEISSDYCDDYDEVLNFLSIIQDNENLKRDFFNKLHEMGSIGLYGYGKIGKYLSHIFPSDLYSIILDKYSDSNKIVFPNRDNIEKINYMIVTPINGFEEISNDLRVLGYSGSIVGFREIARKFMKDYVERCIGYNQSLLERTSDVN